MSVTNIKHAAGNSNSIFGGRVSALSWQTLREQYRLVRAESVAICAPLETEDYVIQTMPEVSPPKWHLAHTTWFFETFILKRFVAGYQCFDDSFEYLFNSYYNAVGTQFPRPQRGLLARPTVSKVLQYREYVDAAIEQFLDNPLQAHDAGQILELGLHHEQQHQELLYTDIKHIFSVNPTEPVYSAELNMPESCDAGDVKWIQHDGGTCAAGYDGQGFAFDNELPRHQVLLTPFALASRPVTNQEYLAFIEDGGYDTASLWLSDGRSEKQQQSWQAPLYWRKRDGLWLEFTLGGLRPLDMTAPVSHISFYEAHAYAGWAGARLPAEAEWEVIAAQEPAAGNLAQTCTLHPASAPPSESHRAAQLFGDVWEWTASLYAAYPGYRAAEGAFGEYNGKFMCNQMVLKGGSCVTPENHIRASYRNFFYPRDRWQFSGLRLARDL